MKIKVTFKDPNGPHDALKAAVKGLSEEEADKVEGAFNRWIRSGEYLTVELDTEADTATVIRNP